MVPTVALILAPAACGAPPARVAVRAPTVHVSGHAAPRAPAPRVSVAEAAAVLRWSETVLWNDTIRFNAAAHPPKRATGSATINHAPHSEAWWHGVSVCEQGGRNDPYFGYFSYMNGSAGGKTWAEQVTMGNHTIATYGDRAWAPRCVAAGYTASPGG